MPQAQITLQRAFNLPTLGVKSQPSPYVIVDCEQTQFTSPIANYNKSPHWMYDFSLQAKDLTSTVHFYIYNNNKNGVDELLAYGSLQFGELLTKTNSEYKLRLVNALHQITLSYLYLNHFDANPKDQYLPLSDRSCIELGLVGNMESMELVCHYGQNSFLLMNQLNKKTFQYAPKYDKIKFTLRGKSYLDSFESDSELLVRNIGQNSFFMLRFYHPERDIYVYLAASLVITGLIPQNFNMLAIKLQELKSSGGKKNNSFKIKVYGPLSETLLNQQKESQIYIENNSNIFIEYFQQGQIIEGRQPYCTFKLPINSLNWKSESLAQTHSFRYYDNFKNIETTLTLNFTLKKNNQLSATIPKLNSPQNLFDQQSNVRIDQFKLNNCYLYEVIKNATVQLAHLDKDGIICTSKKWTVKQDKSEVIVDTKLNLRQGGKGVLVLLCLDFGFTDKQSKNIEDSVIFKVNIDKISTLSDQKIDFSSKFLAYAKKKSLVGVCKLFNQMVHDSLMTIKVKSSYCGQLKNGMIKIINIKATGNQADLDVKIKIDGVNLSVNGLVGNYLLDKPFWFNLGGKNLHFQVQMQNFYAQKSQFDLKYLNKISKDTNKYIYNWHGKVQQLFGTPIKAKIYMFESKISQFNKLQIVYEFLEQPLVKLQEIKRQKQSYIFGNSPVLIKLRKASLPVNKQTYKFSITRSSYTYETFQYKSNNQQILFDSSQQIYLKPNQNSEQDFLFFSCHSYDDDSNLAIYNGAMNIRQIFGKGEYEVLLTNQKEGKIQFVYLVFSVLHSASSPSSSVKISISKIQLNQAVQSLRSVYKYYLVMKNSSNAVDIVECTLQERIFKLKCSSLLLKDEWLDIDFYSSIKAISREQFYQSQKQLIARGKVFWPQVQESGCFCLHFYPKKESQIKLTKNELILQQQTIKLFLFYTAQTNKLQSQQKEISIQKVRLDLDVLSDGVAKITLNEYVATNFQGKVVQIQVNELNLDIYSQSRLKLNKAAILKAANMQLCLNAVITLKKGANYRKIMTRAIVKLRGKHYKSNQQMPIKFEFQNYFYITANCTIFYNKFTCNCRGEFLFSDFLFQGQKVDKFQISFCENERTLQSKQSLLKRQGSQSKKCAVKIQVKDILNILVANLQIKGSKYTQLLSLGQLPIEQFQQEQNYIRQLRINGEIVILSMKYKYLVQKSQSKLEQIVKYTLFGDTNQKYLEVQYNNSLASINAPKKSMKPKKSKGFLYKITVPKILASQTTSVKIFFENQQQIILKPSIVNPLEFNYYSSTKKSIKDLKVLHSKTLNKSIQCLGELEGVIKYIIDQNHEYICTLQIKQVDYSDIGKENWTFKIKLHQILALSKKRLLHLKNTIHDQILTKRLGIALKHADQCYFIYDIDQFGSTKESLKTDFQFGYNANSFILEIFLFVDNYFSRKYKDNSERLFRNWVQLMPISYAAINLSSATEQSMIGCKLQPTVNFSINLQKEINNLIVREENIFALGQICFELKQWAHLELKLKSNTGILFNESKQKQRSFIHYKIEIQKSSRQCLKSLTTQARLVQSNKELKFTNNSLSILLIQQLRQQQFNLKITAFIIDSFNHYQLFQKKHEITEYLQKRGKFQLYVTIKPQETNNIVTKTFQLAFQISSLSTLDSKADLIQKAKDINKVDALSFRDMSGNQFFDKIVSCQQRSHLYECLQELKESFIYQQDPQIQLIMLVSQYLSLNFDSKILELICQIIQLTLLKTAFVFAQIQRLGLVSFYYKQFKEICKGQQKEPPKEIIIMNSELFKPVVEKFKKEKTILSLRSVIENQKYLLYSKDKENMLAAASRKNVELFLGIIDLFLNNSKEFRELFSKQLDQWIQAFGFVQSAIQFQMFVGLLRTCIQKQITFQQTAIIQWIDILVQRHYSLASLNDFWDLLKDKEEKISIYLQILNKYESNFQLDALDTCRGAKLMLSKLLISWKEDSQKLWQIHERVAKIILQNIRKTEDIMQISSNLDFLIYLNDNKILPQPQKNAVSVILKGKSAIFKDNSSKIILSSLSSKFNKHKQVKIVQKKDGKSDEPMSKQGFYSKYLITND